MLQFKVVSSLKVDFPLTAWVAVLVIYKYDGGKTLYPLFPLFTSVRMIQDRVENVKFEISNVEIEVANELVMVPVTWERNYPLKPQYWDKPQVKYSQNNRIDAFVNFLDKPAFHKLLVTPYELIGNSFTLVAALPVLTVHPEADIELFMKMSDFVVNEKASAAAIYNVGSPFTLNWVTGEVTKTAEVLTMPELR